MIKDWPKRAVLSAMEVKEESDEEDNNLGSILGGVEDKRGHGLMFVDIMVADRKLNALVDTCAPNLFISKEATCKLGLKIKNKLGQIKTVNSKNVPIKRVEKRVDLQLSDWTGKASIKEGKHGGKTLSAIQFAKGVRRDEVSYLATLKIEETVKSIGEIPKEVGQVL
ncbi:hypothetical protein GOBAR_AA40114 [Gossypium barbadense]|uniref:Aspartic peptidase DDI1-type domain-containing protein n=1 Tax=Gossypium barbadense TaxID=3634 RepID=A0A2P5VP19_GOSBA|nr:hypothetical protein GOBAR_AA40114 [Gossypium barbadense]